MTRSRSRPRAACNAVRNATWSATLHRTCLRHIPISHRSRVTRHLPADIGHGNGWILPSDSTNQRRAMAGYCYQIAITHNMPIYGELGRYPLSITIKQRMVCYWTRILKSNQHKLNKVMYDILYNLHCKDIHSSGWIKYINTIFQNNGMSYIWATQDFNVDSNNVYKCECDQFKRLWHSRITCDAIDSNNMMYKTFKYSHGKEKYTEILPEHFKKALLQFRIGSHKLPVNNRKHFNVPRADRHCTHCDQSIMGDEIHFLYECPKLNNLRVKYMYSPDIRREPNVFNFVNIMQTNDPVTIGNLAKFILHGLKLYT